MTERVARLGLGIEAGPETDAAELGELAASLRELLLELDVERADVVPAGPAPPGTRAGDILVTGALTVTLVLSSRLLTALVETVRMWVSSAAGRRVRLEIDGDVLEVDGLTRQDQHKLIHAWIDRHTNR